MGFLVNLHLDERGSQGSLGNLVEVSISMAQIHCKAQWHIRQKLNQSTAIVLSGNIVFLCYRAQEFWMSFWIWMLDLDRLGLSCFLLFSVLTFCKCVNHYLSYLRTLIPVSILFLDCFSLLPFHNTFYLTKERRKSFQRVQKGILQMFHYFTTSILLLTLVISFCCCSAGQRSGPSSLFLTLYTTMMEKYSLSNLDKDFF